MRSRRRTEARRLSAFAEDVLEVIEAAAHEGTIERLAGLAIVALPAAPLDALRESLVGRGDRPPLFLYKCSRRAVRGGLGRGRGGGRRKTPPQRGTGGPGAARRTVMIY